MELSGALRDPLGAARGLRRRVGRTVRRLQDRVRYALPSENGLLRDLGGRFGTLDEALRELARDTSRLFVADIPRAEAAAFLAEHPGRRARVLERAAAARAHRFDLLGSGPVDLGPRLPWHADFVSGYAWDRHAHFRELVGRIEAEFGSGRDVKIPWELSRFQHAPCLGQAFWLTGDRGCYEAFRDQVRDWVRHNRAPFGVNWTCTMDVAVRAVNWVWGYAFFRPEILADRPFASLLLRSLFIHGRFIADNLENGGPVTSNHYLADLLGLLFLGVLLRGSPEADVWKATAVAEIVRESERQTLPDGADYEASTAYHRLKTEMLLTALLLMERSRFSFPALRARVRSMIEYVAHYTKPDGLAPQIGDNDDGRLQILGDYDADRRDHRHLLGVAGVAFEDPALVLLAGPRVEEALWLCGPARLRRALAAAARVPHVAVTGRLFPHAGTAILRDGDLYAALDAGPVGLQGHGAHAHNDTLAVEIQAGGRDLIVDPGTGGYTRDLRLRQRFRSTAAHNTVRVDGQEINPLPDLPFALPGADRPAVLRFESRRGFDLVEAEHGGYLRLADPVRHRRVLLLNKRTRRFVLEDHLEGRGRHRLEFFFHLAPGSEAFVEDGAGVACRAGGVRFRIRPTLAPAGLRALREEDLFSPGYGRVVPALTVRFDWQGGLPLVVRFAIEVGG
jgi:hypothetical protein